MSGDQAQTYLHHIGSVMAWALASAYTLAHALVFAVAVAGDVDMLVVEHVAAML